MIIIYALIGLIVGGLINLLADALPNRKPLAPIGSLLRWPMPLRNLIVEVGTAIAFAIIYAQPLFAEPLRLILGSFHVAVLILVTVIDLEHRLILNKVIFPSIIVAALTSFFWFGPGWYLAFVGGAIGFMFFWLAAWLGRLILRRNALGAGDVKLAAYIGLITGFPGIITALVITILAGGIISILLLLVRVVNLRSGIPYGPFLVIGGFMTVLWGTPIMNGFFFR
ncbi:MAG TPA: A24 family peptidase [Anaerolineae bacterium]|nr:A24 family peptidase [Anaerolineae bacterium]